MASSPAQQHWETVYATKQPHQVSWTQPVPATSLEFIRSFPLDKQARIIDVGGGDSQLVDFLLAEGYEHITVLDISATALAKARRRLGARARRVNWVVSDVLAFRPTTTFDVWHDRATFHFLTTPAQIAHYLALAQAAIRPHGYLTIGTFSPAGPAQCSGLPVQQYSEQELTGTLARGFAKIRCRTEDHRTPFQTLQNFLFCSFQRRLSPRTAPPAVAGASQLAPAFLSNTVLYIKHMVCPRGVRVVRQELERLDLRVLDVRLGAATVGDWGRSWTGCASAKPWPRPALRCSKAPTTRWPRRSSRRWRPCFSARAQCGTGTSSRRWPANWAWTAAACPPPSPACPVTPASAATSRRSG